MTDLVANIRARLAPLLDEAEGALERRARQYPDLVAKGRMQEKVAADEIRIWTAIVADWRRVVSARGEKGVGATVREKIAVLTDAIGRYDTALASEIRNAGERVQRDCAMGADLYALRVLHGAKVDGIADIHQRRARIEDLAEHYRWELPGHAGLYAGIDDYLAFHQQIRADRQQRKAA